MKYHYLVPALAMALLLTGCRLVPDTYVSVTASENSAASADPYKAITIGDAADLKNELLKLVERGTQEAVLTAENYAGELAQDCDNVIDYFLHEDPKTSYVVQSIAPDLTQAGIYYKLNLSISYYYDRDYADLKNIPTVYKDEQVKTAIVDALNANTERLFLRVSNYSEAKYAPQYFEDLVRECFLADPVSIIAKPEVVPVVSPNHGADRIIELKFTYRISLSDQNEQKVVTSAELDLMGKAVESLINSAKEYVNYAKSDNEKASQLYSYLVGLHRYRNSIGSSNTTAYTMLIDGEADSRVFAYVYQEMCSQAGLACLVVDGKKGEDSYCWNIINIDGNYCHMDLFADEQNQLRSPRFLTDAQMEGYAWDTSTYPKCTGLPEPPAPVTVPAAQTPDTPEAPSSDELPTEQTPDPPAPLEPVSPSDPDPE